jgi:membrane protease YdiL (CAAX protease family)
VYRALFFRRFGYLFRSNWQAISLGMLMTGIIYFMITASIAGFGFGCVLGAVLGWTYLRTGQFLMNVALHWVAVLCICLIGQGLTVL